MEMIARRRRIRGFTLVEVLVSTVLLLGTIAGAGAVFRAENRLFAAESSALRRQEQARRLLDVLIREIRSAGYAPRGPGAPFQSRSDGVSRAFADRIDLCGDWHGARPSDMPDGVVDLASAECIAFYVSGRPAALMQKLGGQVLAITWQIEVAPGGFALRYYDACDAEITPPPLAGLAEADRARIRRIALSLRLRDARSDVVEEARASITLRNRLDDRCAA